MGESTATGAFANARYDRATATGYQSNADYYGTATGWRS